MGLGTFQLLNAPSASLEVQTFQCPQPYWIDGATANVALAARVGGMGGHTVVIIGDHLSLFNSSGGEPLLATDRDETDDPDVSVASAGGALRIRRTSARNKNFRSPQLRP